MSISLRKAGMSDCKQIHEMQIQSFASLLDKYNDYHTNPGAESIERIIQKMEQEFSTYYFICLGNKIIGAVRIGQVNDHSFRIAPIFILPQYQDMGYAQQAILAIESLYPHAKYWELDTIKQETKQCYLYEKMGYRPTGKEEELQEGMTIIYYRKTFSR